uniref:(northern house mosquito) hypothetical protein n=1 Tax=Culex pipiens TaxID=7175 RepID=A0A8D8J6P1_CULPI
MILSIQRDIGQIGGNFVLLTVPRRPRRSPSHHIPPRSCLSQRSAHRPRRKWFKRGKSLFHLILRRHRSEHQLGTLLRIQPFVQFGRRKRSQQRFVLRFVHVVQLLQLVEGRVVNHRGGGHSRGDGGGSEGGGGGGWTGLDRVPVLFLVKVLLLLRFFGPRFEPRFAGVFAVGGARGLLFVVLVILRIDVTFVVARQRTYWSRSLLWANFELHLEVGMVAQPEAKPEPRVRSFFDWRDVGVD